MKKNAEISLQDNIFYVCGDLNFSNVMPILEKSLQQANQCSKLVFDFSQVTSSDSAALALIVEWIKLSKQQNKPIHFTQLSDEIMSIAKAAGLEAMFNGVR